MTPRILITGATGYVGGRLLEQLASKGHNVRCLVRDPTRLRLSPDHRVDVKRGDVMKPATLPDALSGVDVAYYLIHSMASSGDFEAHDRLAATHFAQAAADAQVRRIIYLGGLGADDESLSPHLRSRHEVGNILRQHHNDVIELRASIVIGSGSLSFEIIRGLVDRLPIMLTPRWVRVKAQPIAIDDLLRYLECAQDVAIDDRRIFEIGGADVVSYGDLMAEYGRQTNHRRLMIAIPLLSLRLSGMWLALVTPVYARVGRILIQSLVHPTVVTDNSATTTFSAITPIGIRRAIAMALTCENHTSPQTRWSDALSSSPTVADDESRRPVRALTDSRTTHLPLSTTQAFTPIRRIGGNQGWYFANWLWRIRGLIDLVFGGVGLRRGRRCADDLTVGDALDFWRVERYEADHYLKLRAEMKVPGRAWLEFTVVATAEGSQITQTATFEPWPISGRIYWFGIWPLHAIVFSGLLRQIGAAALREAMTEIGENVEAQA